MRASLARVLPLLAAGACILAMLPAYAEVLRAGHAALAALAPLEPEPLAVTAEGTRLRVVTGRAAAERRVGFVEVLAIGWNLPVLVALLGWLAPRRWRLGLLAAAFLVLLHVGMAELEIRRLSGPLPPLAELLWRAWYPVAAPLLPFLLAGLAWALPRAPAHPARA